MTVPASQATGEIQQEHIRELLDRLDEYERDFLGHREGPEPSRLFFMDCDVMAAFIDGQPRNYFGWPSLLSLREASERRGNEPVTPTVRQLADTLSQAITRFLFGPFLSTLTVQRGKFYVTPEHARELNAITLAIVGELRETSIASSSWLDELQRRYVGLCNSEHSATAAVKNAQAIVEHLSTHAGMGRVSRTHALQSKYTTPLSAHIVSPQTRGDRAFIFDTRTPTMSERVSTHSATAFEVFTIGLGERHPAARQYFDIKRKVFSVHGPTRRMVDYVRTTLDDAALARHHAPAVLEQQAMIAAREVADVVSLARMVALVDSLEAEHLLSSGSRWEVCLITGSALLRELHRDWLKRDSRLSAVRVIHPLCYLRHPELFDPDGVRGVAQTLNEPLDDEYALRQILSHDRNASVSPHVDPGRFCESLQRSLVGVVARTAEEDRSMRALRVRLKHDESFDHSKYVAVVRGSIAYFFFKAFRSINELAPDHDALLPPASLPALALPKPGKRGIAAAEMYFVRLLDLLRSPATTAGRGKKLSNLLLRKRSSRELGQQYADLLDDVLNEDDTGYSTMLCAAVGYIAKGRSWLGAAETMASTATMLALGGPGSRYPQGNEALYLKAFLLRMRFMGDEEGVGAWLDHHGTVMGQAVEILEAWRRDEHELATERIASTSAHGSYSRFDMVALRYKVERAAAEVFVTLALLANQRACAESRERFVMPAKMFGTVHGLLLDWLPWTAVTPLSIHRPGLDFLGSQLWAVVLQGWICLTTVIDRPISEREGVDPQIAEQVARLPELIAPKLREYMDAKPTGYLLRMLAEIFFIRSAGDPRGRYQVSEATFAQAEFAAIDSRWRFPFLREQWLTARPQQG